MKLVAWRHLGFTLLALAALVSPAEAQDCSVIGHNDPASDVANVQSAVDTCANVFLMGTFDFRGMETGTPLSVIKVLKSVNIVGLQDRGKMPTIKGGEAPFLSNASSAVVQIVGLRFLSSKFRSVLIGDADSVSVAGCVMEGTVPAPSLAGLAAFGIVVGGPDFPGAQVNSVSIMDNLIDVGGPGFEQADTVGVILFVNAMEGGQILTTHIARNVITNATGHGIDLRNLGGSVEVDLNVVVIEHNVQRSGDAPLMFVDGIRCLGPTTLCAVHDNRIDTHHPNSAGVRLQRTSDATVTMNEINLILKHGTTPGVQSAGVQVIAKGPGELVSSTHDNVVSQNTITGRARTALSVVGPDAPLMSEDNKLIRNQHPRFVASYADVEVGVGVLATVIEGEEGKICDLGIDTKFINSALPQPAGNCQ